MIIGNTGFQLSEKNNLCCIRKTILVFWQDVSQKLIFFPIGFLYLWIRYRNSEKVAEIKREHYENSYSVAGSILVLSGFGVVLFVLLSGFLIAAIYALFKHPPTAY